MRKFRTQPTSREDQRQGWVKPAQYAKAGVPLYLLVDQERTAWTLFGLGDKPGYQIVAAGKFGESVPLPAPFGFSVETTEWPS